MAILLVVINGYLLMVIGDYFINGYFINDYWWLF
jgi:hypothetical protein